MIGNGNVGTNVVRLPAQRDTGDLCRRPMSPDSPLRHLPNVTLTPHIAGASVKTVRIAAAQAAEEVRRWLAHEPPLNPC